MGFFVILCLTLNSKNLGPNQMDDTTKQLLEDNNKTSYALDGDVYDELGQLAISMDEGRNSYEDQQEMLDRAIELANSLENIAALYSNSPNGVDSHAARLANITIESHGGVEDIAVNLPDPSTCGSSRTRQEFTSASLESLTKTLSDLTAKIIQVITAAWHALMDFFSKIYKYISIYRKILVNNIKKAKNLKANKATPKQDSVPLPPALRYSFQIRGVTIEPVSDILGTKDRGLILGTSAIVGRQLTFTRELITAADQYLKGGDFKKLAGGLNQDRLVTGTIQAIGGKFQTKPTGIVASADYFPGNREFRLESVRAESDDVRDIVRALGRFTCSFAKNNEGKEPTTSIRILTLDQIIFCYEQCIIMLDKIDERKIMLRELDRERQRAVATAGLLLDDGKSSSLSVSHSGQGAVEVARAVSRSIRTNMDLMHKVSSETLKITQDIAEAATLCLAKYN